jgi:hypothetical protein
VTLEAGFVITRVSENVAKPAELRHALFEAFVQGVSLGELIREAAGDVPGILVAQLEILRGVLFRLLPSLILVAHGASSFVAGRQLDVDRASDLPWGR